ncbi:phosphatase PAP2 family protein [Brevundimonas sp.]|uniref:phosphatase PAP2 family protein n=1 Tax=Brevundimonas sp. TaxID=1871086 RepID=UPI0025BCBC22|nr:phosphatase PAP2 family protein [Brevundimonas sp.]
MKPTIRAALSWAALSVLIVTTGCAGTPAALTDVDGEPARQGYLSDAELQALVATIPAPPAPGSMRALEDIERSDRFRALEDSDRWLLATAHAEIRPPLALQHFDCALGVRLGSAETPVLNRMMGRLFHDVDTVAEAVKALHKRPRPVAADPARRACQTVSDASRASSSYPSGTSALATAYGETFAVMAPDRGAAVRSVARSIGESRLVCAMHWPSDVAEGETVGFAVFARIASSVPAFDADLAAARVELDRTRTAGLTNPGCAAERAALATPLP